MYIEPSSLRIVYSLRVKEMFMCMLHDSIENIQVDVYWAFEFKNCLCKCYMIV
jgi:hypothetical protein